MPTLVYMQHHDTPTSTNDTSTSIITTITHPLGETNIILPPHPNLPTVTVIAVTRAIYAPIGSKPLAVSLTSLLLYYEFYGIPQASDLAITLHLTSSNLTHAATNILYLARNHSKFKMGTYLYHMRAAGTHFGCPVLFLSQFGSKSNTIAKDAQLLATHFRTHAAIQAAHAPFITTPVSPPPDRDTGYTIPTTSQQQCTYYVCPHCGTSIRDTYTKRLTHPSKCPAMPKTLKHAGKPVF